MATSKKDLLSRPISDVEDGWALACGCLYLVLVNQGRGGLTARVTVRTPSTGTTSTSCREAGHAQAKATAHAPEEESDLSDGTSAGRATEDEGPDWGGDVEAADASYA